MYRFGPPPEYLGGAEGLEEPMPRVLGRTHPLWEEGASSPGLERVLSLWKGAGYHGNLNLQDHCHG